MFSVLFADKKSNEYRFCINYRKINEITIKNKYIISLVSEMLEHFKNVKYFTCFDLKHTYHLLCVAEDYKHKTVFKTRYENYEYLVVFFNLCNTLIQFQQFI